MKKAMRILVVTLVLSIGGAAPVLASSPVPVPIWPPNSSLTTAGAEWVLADSPLPVPTKPPSPGPCLTK